MGDMRPTFAKGNKTAISKLLELRRQAQKDKEPRVVLRIQGILMSLEGVTAGEISNRLRCIAAQFRCGSITGIGMAIKAYRRDIGVGGPAV